MAYRLMNLDIYLHPRVCINIVSLERDLIKIFSGHRAPSVLLPLSFWKGWSMNAKISDVLTSIIRLSFLEWMFAQCDEHVGSKEKQYSLTWGGSRSFSLKKAVWWREALVLVWTFESSRVSMRYHLACWLFGKFFESAKSLSQRNSLLRHVFVAEIIKYANLSL